MPNIQQVMLSAIKPTNQITLGNYLGAIKNWVAMQDRYNCYFFAVDLHSITLRQDPKALRENTRFALAVYLASGLSPEKCQLFVQSHVSAHAELAWILNCNSYMGELSRMTQYKDKSALAGKNIPAGLFNYPTLMAADILLYNANLVPVGEDQKQHIELTRNLAERFNNAYGLELFTVPSPYIAPVGARIMDLQEPTKKMGKSDSSAMGAIYLADDEKTIVKKIKRAVTDSGSEISYDESKPGIRNLIEIQAAITGKTPESIVETYRGKQYGYLKVETADMVAEHLRPIQEKAKTYLSDPAELDKILLRGAAKARQVAQTTLARVYDAVGFVPH